MQFFKSLNLNPMQLLKFLGIVVLGLLLLSVAGSVIMGNLNGTRNIGPYNTILSQSAPSTGAQPEYYGTDSNVAYDLSIRNVVGISEPPRPGEEYVSGADAEAFEVKEYRGTIETRNLDLDCDVIQDLKSRGEVVFERANEYERGCSYTFKVANDHVPEILAIIKSLNPRELAESTYTIKRQIEDFTSESEILEKKLASIDATLQNAITAYDDITKLATNVRDVESLAKIIDSKITIIEKLTQERIRTNAELERLTRAKTEQLDRLEYTYFYIDVSENTFIDGRGLADSWKNAVRTFVRDTNLILQKISIGIGILLLRIVQFGIYFIILLFVARFGWRITQKIWQNGLK